MTLDDAAIAGAKRDLDEEEAPNEDAAKRLRGDDAQPAPASEPETQPPYVAAPEEVCQRCSPLSLALSGPCGT